MTEDTALEFQALKGLPGPYMYVLTMNSLCHATLLPPVPYVHADRSVSSMFSADTLSHQSRKHFLGALGHEGLNNMLAAYQDKTAFAVCTFAYCAGPGHEPILFQGRTRGKIVPARGPPNFGMSRYTQTSTEPIAVNESSY